jgi:RNA polymerase sigma-70 factor (ECF subfamily)
MNTDRENILWNNFKEGRPNSFRPLFDYFYVPLCEYAVQILKDKMDAEDVVLDTFFFIWKNSDRIDIGKSIRSYLFTSVKNRSLNHLRSVRSETLEDIHDIPVLDPALADIDIKDISAVICAALETVSERARSVWKMKREDGKTNIEIAHQLNVSEKTVEADVTRIRKLLNLTIKRNFILTLFF